LGKKHISHLSILQSSHNVTTKLYMILYWAYVPAGLNLCYMYFCVNYSYRKYLGWYMILQAVLSPEIENLMVRKRVWH